MFSCVDNHSNDLNSWLSSWLLCSVFTFWYRVFRLIWNVTLLHSTSLCSTYIILRVKSIKSIWNRTPMDGTKQSKMEKERKKITDLFRCNNEHAIKCIPQLSALVKPKKEGNRIFVSILLFDFFILLSPCLFCALLLNYKFSFVSLGRVGSRFIFICGFKMNTTLLFFLYYISNFHSSWRINNFTQRCTTFGHMYIELHRHTYIQIKATTNEIKAWSHTYTVLYMGINEYDKRLCLRHLIQIL